MKQMRFLGFYCLGLLALGVFVGSPRLGAHDLSVSGGTTFVGRELDLRVTLDATDVVQGVQAIAKWDPGVIVGVDIQASDFLTLGPDGIPDPGGDGDAADTVIAQVDDDHFVLGVVLDSDPFDNTTIPGEPGDAETIPVGDGQLLATVTVRGVTPNTSTDVTFVDGEFGVGTPSGGFGPELDNLVVVDGLSIVEGPDLGLNGNTVTVQDVPPGEYVVESAVAPAGNDEMMVNVLLNSVEPVQGYVVSLGNDAAVELIDATSSGTDAAALPGDGPPSRPGVEFEAVDVTPEGGFVAVVLDFDPPFDNQTIQGEGVSIARFRYRVVDPPDIIDCDVDPPVKDPAVVGNLTFVDNVFGDPLQENVVVIAGLSKNPLLTGGTVTFPPPPCPPKGFLDTAFAAGGELFRCERSFDSSVGGNVFILDNGEFVFEPDAFGDLVPDPEGAPGPLQGGEGEVIPVSFYYLSPPVRVPIDDRPGGNLDQDMDDIQGLQMAVSYGEGLSCTGGFSTEGTITEAVGAEFVSVECENTGSGELVIAILVDALPPFDGQTLPPTSDFLKAVSVDFEITNGTICGEIGEIEFEDGVSPNDNPPTNNVISVMNASESPVGRFPPPGGGITVGKEPTFQRGDCNFDEMVDIADAASVISFLFLTGTWKFNPDCLDACDANDDARIDLADSVTVLRYLFKSDQAPPAPGPNQPGPDPTADKLDCVRGRACP